MLQVMVTQRTKRSGDKPEGLPDGLRLVGFNELLNEDVLVITGGEPMAISERVVEMVHRLRLQGFTGKIYVRTEDVHRLGKYWAVGMLIDDIDGIIYQIKLREEKVLKEKLTDLRRLDTELEKLDRVGRKRSDILEVFEKLYKPEYISTLTHKWYKVAKVRNFEAKSREWNRGEKVFYDLEAEG